MGLLTRTEIITQGQAEAGVRGKDTRLLEALVLWEQSQYKKWPFKFLQKRKEQLSLPAGTTSLRVGAGESGITNLIQKIHNPIFIGASGYTTASKANIIGFANQDLAFEEKLANPTTTRGLPTGFKVYHDLSTVAPYRSCKMLVPVPVPDRDYLITFSYWEIPATAQSGTGGGIPLYPNDQTMKKFVEMMATKWVNGAADPDYQTLRDELSAMVLNDQVKEGQAEGHLTEVPRDPVIFL